MRGSQIHWVFYSRDEKDCWRETNTLSTLVGWRVFVEDHRNYPAKKDYFSSAKAKTMRQALSFESWGSRADPTIVGSTYLAYFLVP